MPKITALATVFLLGCLAHGSWHYLGHRRYQAAVARCQESYRTYPAGFQTLCKVVPAP